MRYLNLGNTGLRVSRVCLGMMSFGRHESRRWALDEAYVPHPVSGIDL